MPAPTTHHRLSPSRSSTWLACPWSLRAPSTPPSAAADEGTEAHGYGAEVLVGERSLANVPPKFAEGVAMYVEHVLANGVKPIVERKWESLEIPDFGGTIDCLLVQDRHAVVYDLKYGKWPVAAESNAQLLCYSAIVSEHFEVTQFHGVIVQPRAFKGDKIKVAEYTPAQVESHRERVKWAAGSEEKNTGEHCRFCSLRTTKQCAEGVAHGKVRGWK